jgi:hydrogenase maturation protease
MNRNVVIGLGHHYRSDDDAGLEAARRVRARGLRKTTVIEHEGDAVDLVQLWAGAQLAVVIDAVRSGKAPGTIHRIDATEERIPDHPRRDSSHAVGLGDAVELGRALGLLPDRLVVVGIEGADFTPGVGLSPEVAAAVDEVVELVVAEMVPLATLGGVG